MKYLIMLIVLVVMGCEKGEPRFVPNVKKDNGMKELYYVKEFCHDGVVYITHYKGVTAKVVYGNGGFRNVRCEVGGL